VPVSRASGEPTHGPAPITVGRLAPAVDGKIVTDPETSGGSIEEYRRLAAVLHAMQAQSGLRTLMIASALPGEGKTLTSANLALTLSESYKRRVLLLDADLRRPSLHQVFGVANSRGLSEALSLPGSQLQPVDISATLSLGPAGPPESSPMAGLTSDRMRRLMQEVAERFDWVILDTPPVGLLSDAHVLARLVDGVLLVVRAGSTPYTAVNRAVLELGRERIVGVLLNCAQSTAYHSAYYDRYYGAARPDAGAREPRP
jgi:capsular exopolysaccharide synthesis family protein